VQCRLQTLLEILNSPGVNRMGLYFNNRTGQKLFVAYAYAWPACPDGGDWAKKGWYAIMPGATAKVQSGAVGGSKFFYFAESDDRRLQWAGPFVTNLPVNAFDWCWNTASSNGRDLGMRKVLVSQGISDHTVNLII
jgi:Protein of unknown function (DUF1036)